MATTRQPNLPGADWPVTLACLRFGADTHAARTLKELVRGIESPGPELIQALAGALGIPAGKHAGQLKEAELYARNGLASARDAGLVPVPWFHDDYPGLLREIVDPPIVLWRAGHAEALLEKPAIAIVGSRDAAPAALSVARRLGRGLAEAGFAVVSGLARGIDGAAHEGALSAGGTTVAVLGCGADIAYPRAHRALMSKVRESGAIVSEFLPGTPPRAHHFPLRNRIISGLCSAVIVAQASMRSGSLITARMALEQGRDVFAVPGTVASGQFGGCHALIKDGAALVETVEDVLGELGLGRKPESRPVEFCKSIKISKLEEAMAIGEAYTVDELAERTRMSGPELLAELGALEVSGIVGRVAGAGFVKFDKSAIGEGHG